MLLSLPNFIKYVQNQNIGVQNNFKVFGSFKSKGPKQDISKSTKDVLSAQGVWHSSHTLPMRHVFGIITSQPLSRAPTFIRPPETQNAARMCSGSVSSSFYTSGMSRVTLVTNQV